MTRLSSSPRHWDTLGVPTCHTQNQHAQLMTHLLASTGADGSGINRQLPQVSFHGHCTTDPSGQWNVAASGSTERSTLLKCTKRVGKRTHAADSTDDSWGNMAEKPSNHGPDACRLASTSALSTGNVQLIFLVDCGRQEAGLQLVCRRQVQCTIKRMPCSFLWPALRGAQHTCRPAVMLCDKQAV